MFVQSARELSSLCLRPEDRRIRGGTQNFSFPRSAWERALRGNVLLRRSASLKRNHRWHNELRRPLDAERPLLRYDAERRNEVY